MPNEKRDDRALGRDELTDREERLGDERESAELRDLDTAQDRPGTEPADIGPHTGPLADEPDQRKRAQRPDDKPTH